MYHHPGVLDSPYLRPSSNPTIFDFQKGYTQVFEYSVAAMPWIGHVQMMPGREGGRTTHSRSRFTLLHPNIESPLSISCSPDGGGGTGT